MRKPAVCKSKSADQLRGYHVADQRPYIRYIVQSLYFINPTLQDFTHLCRCTARFVVDLVGNPVTGFSHDAAHFVSISENILSNLEG